MNENAPVLMGQPRTRLGSRESRRLRSRGGLPAVVYGHKEEPASVTLDARDTIQHLSKGERIFQLQMENETDTQVVLVKEIQFDYLGTNPIHVDLARVSLTERVNANVPVRLVGEAKGLKAAGAVLLHPSNDVEIECEVRHLPEHLDLNIRDLQVNETILAEDLPLPEESMKLLSDPNAVLAQIVVQELPEEVEEAAEVSGEAAEPEVIGEKERVEKSGEDENKN